MLYSPSWPRFNPGKTRFVPLFFRRIELDPEGSWTARPRPCASPRRAQSKSFWQIRKKGACGQQVYRGAREVTRRVTVPRQSLRTSQFAPGPRPRAASVGARARALINSSAQVHTRSRTATSRTRATGPRPRPRARRSRIARILRTATLRWPRTKSSPRCARALGDAAPARACVFFPELARTASVRPFRPPSPAQIHWTYVRVPPGAVEGEQLHVRTPEDLTQEVRVRRSRDGAARVHFSIQDSERGCDEI